MGQTCRADRELVFEAIWRRHRGRKCAVAYASFERCVRTRRKLPYFPAYFTVIGLKRLGDGALVKDYEGPEKETETAVQLSLLEVSSEDSRYQEQIPPPISEEFPDVTKVFFLGEHAYGTAAQVSSTTPTSLAVVLAVSNWLGQNTTLANA